MGIKKKVIIIIGRSAAGKDTIAKIISERYQIPIAISTTTRPMRSNETDGVNYHFVSDDEFDKLDLVESRTYNTIQDGKPTIWKYGLTFEAIDITSHSVITVVDTDGMEAIQNYVGKENTISFYINSPFKERIIRAMARDLNFEEEEFQRREDADREKMKRGKKQVNHIIENEILSKAVFKIGMIMERKELI